jgi:hypothetical protein
MRRRFSSDRHREQKALDFRIVETALKVGKLPFSPPHMLDAEVSVAEAAVLKDQQPIVECKCSVRAHSRLRVAEESVAGTMPRSSVSWHSPTSVMAISGHSSTRMVARYTHPTEERKISALDLPAVATNRSQTDSASDEDGSTASEIAKLLKEIGGRQGDRTPDLCIANAALSQLS